MTPRHDNLRFVGYDQSVEVPNIVVDGSPNKSTVLTLTHWPGIEQPKRYARDLSAQMAFAFSDDPIDRGASVVTNNHYDQDGLVAVFALTMPEAASTRREILIDLAAAGDFATYRHRSAARTSMVIAAYADPDRSPIASELAPLDQSAQAECLYVTTLGLLAEMVDHPDRFRELWADEDADLTACEMALEEGLISIEEHGDIDLALVTVPERSVLAGGHRFSHERFDTIHPMALNNATRMVRLLVARGHNYTYTDRYETWVQYHSRRVPRRVDLAPLARALSDLESGGATWFADPPSALTPRLRHDEESSLEPATVKATLRNHLRTAPPAWNPYNVID